MIDVGVAESQVSRVADGAYPDVLASLVSNAQRRCLCSVFIVDVDPVRDPDLLVHDVLQRLQASDWRGVDVRLLIGGSRRTLQIAESAQAARTAAIAMGVTARWLSSRPVRGSHAKLVIADNTVLVGSHNWSAGAFSGQRQESVAVASPGLAEFFAAKFDEQWARAEP